MEDFVARLVNTTRPVVALECNRIAKSLSKVKEIIDVDKKEDENKNTLQQILSKNEQIQCIDQALKQFAINHNLASAEDD